MKIAIYPGSFNPWHAGHSDVLFKALQVFDRVVIAVGRNPDKDSIVQRNLSELWTSAAYGVQLADAKRLQVIDFEGFLSKFANEWRDEETDLNACAIVRGLRNSSDLESEKAQQYWLEDLDLNLPIAYFICDRELSHISSSSIRAVSRIKGR